VYAYFTYAATASEITDDVTKLVMHRVLYIKIYAIFETLWFHKVVQQHL